jgi:hypothetical protein
LLTDPNISSTTTFGDKITLDKATPANCGIVNYSDPPSESDLVGLSPCLTFNVDTSTTG